MSDLNTIQNQRETLKAAYSGYRNRKRLLFIVLLPVVMILIGWAVTMGSADLSLRDVFAVIFGKIVPGVHGQPSHADIIIWKLRLPRVLMGLLSGIALSCSGAVMQTVLRNPLADPYILGISSAAGFGASLAIIFGVGIGTGPYLVMGNAFVFSLLSSGIILALSARKNASPQAMVLTGLALLFFFQALTTIVQFFGKADAVKAAVFWTVGDLGRAGWQEVAISAPLVVVGCCLLCWKARDLNIISAGDETARSLGIHVAKTRIFSMIVCTLMVAGIVCFTGTIGFIGLVAPHLVRLLIGQDNQVLLPASGLLGGALLIVSDTVARTVLSPIILPVGALTAFLGVPLFLHLILRKSSTLL